MRIRWKCAEERREMINTDAETLARFYRLGTGTFVRFANGHVGRYTCYVKKHSRNLENNEISIAD